MDTNFNEQQAFADLQTILNHMYTLADKFYGELQAAQAANREKDQLLAERREEIFSLEKKLDEQEKTFSARLKELGDSNARLNEQLKNFENDLKKYGNYNMQLTERLKNFEEDLKLKESNLDKRGEEISTREQTLKDEQKTLDEDKKNFQDKQSETQAKLDSFDALQQRAKDFDDKLKKIRDEYSGQLEEFKIQYQQAQETIAQLTQDKLTLEEKVKARNRQIELLNEKISSRANNFESHEQPDQFDGGY